MKKKANNIRKSADRRMRTLGLALYDVAAVWAAEWLALLARFDFNLESMRVAEYVENMKLYTPVNIAACLFFFAVFKLYSTLWRYASVRELLNLATACVLGAGAQIAGMHMLYLNMPRAYYLLFFLFLLALIAAERFFCRGLHIVSCGTVRADRKKAVPTMVIGAGDAGCTLMKEMISSEKISNRLVCVIDDDVHKIGNRILGVPIVGDHTQIREAAKRYGVEEIFIAIPSLSGKEKQEIYDICKETKCRLKTLPSMAQLINGEVRLQALRDVEIEDLLGREPVRVNLDEVMGYISGRKVLVTGAGGSIGSELSRQIAKHAPSELILLDIYENTLYDVQQELKREMPGQKLTVLIASVRNTHRVEQIFDDYRPDIVFHAAAHKHVPLMEDSPNEAVKNNVFGTLNVARAAAKYHAARMVLISTDKAVNPTNIMGATKRICEMVIQGMERMYPATNYVAVRFGNVLGSNGSVIPLFKKQIAAGGPVTVTDRRIIRYFMTIPEAVSLVLQAGAYAKGGEIFVLDMGEPVRIDDMARNLIKLSGYEPDVDIRVEYTGLRPGEKLYEECLKEEEGLRKTANNLIFIGKPLDFDERQFFERLARLKEKAYEDTDGIKRLVGEIVPSYRYGEADRQDTADDTDAARGRAVEESAGANIRKVPAEVIHRDVTCGGELPAGMNDEKEYGLHAV